MSKWTIEEEKRTTRKAFPTRTTGLWYQEWVKAGDSSSDFWSVNWESGDGCYLVLLFYYYAHTSPPPPPPLQADIKLL